ncbi:putative PWWP domain-containing protein [Lupinus albus]|uniref:Putative PWWP domain-containing protein n=1 Tax=Lupinus albus TaxID=3870 RepID=A0A6A4NB49_LUPAL|nr:putative PWWP domain-containing protein [Lupinus albus]
MAPSRRRVSSKAAAAACREWKIGDLVLAKLKGFPAWPATVSEPEKWGYKTDLKKVLVHFFGTQQIAFCNPADVEAFTEEKKQSLVKRQGKGADFVRAVREIVDSYDRLKKEEETQHHEAATGEVADANVSNPADSFAKDQTHALELTLNLSIKTSDSVTNRQELECAAEDDSVLALNDESYNKDASEEPSNNVSAEKSLEPVTYSSRKRSTGQICQQGYLRHINAPVRRSRSSSWVQNSLMPCSDSGKIVGDLSANVARSAYVRRNKCISKSPDLYGCDDFDSSAFVSNGSVEENGSEVLTIDSNAFSLNEGSTIDSNFKLEDTIERLEVELNKRLDVEIKSVVNKKKRKPSRKRVSHDVTKLANKPEDEAAVQNACQSSLNICGNSEGRFVEYDGDEHLPLLKRLRVRMGQPSSTEAELNNFVQAQEKSCKEDINSSPEIVASSNCENGESFLLNGASNNLSPSKMLAPSLDTQIYNTKKDQTVCSVDDEAALPPSKRLHRALEAMSANATEEFQAHTEATSSIMTSSGKCCISTVKRCPCMAINDEEGSGVGSRELDNCGTGPSCINVSSFSTSSNPIISLENESSIQVDKQLTKLQQHKIGKDVLSGFTDQVGEDLSGNVVCVTTKTDLEIQLHRQISPDLGLKCCEGESNQDLLQNDEDSIRADNCSNTAFNTSERNGTSLDPVAASINNDFLAPNNIDAPPNEVICEDSKCLKLPAVDSSKSNDMSVIVKEIKCKEPEDGMNFISTCDDLGEKGILGTRSSPSLTDVGDCIPHGSPPNTPLCNVSMSDSSNILQNGSCSPVVQPKQTLSGPGTVDGSKVRFAATQQSRSMDKSTDAGHAALCYFEAMLGTLKRTKESISRATHIAIDCAKFGSAAKVMEILAHNLETESSLHRRVDLFFLVDSIAQSSRGLKGDVCGVYPSAIQAVLPRLLSAAAPPGNTARENHRQCRKVLRVWLERRILPESIVCHHIRELDSYSNLASACVHSRRTSRTERSIDDPVREMEGMLVDEYGSNSSFKLPGFCIPRVLTDADERSDSDGGNFEAVTPEHSSEVHEVSSTIEKHRHILEDVDGELEMEDVSPSCDVEINSIQNVNEGNAPQFHQNLPLPLAPLPQDVQSSSPPLSSSPSPPPLPPTLHVMKSASDPYHTVVNTKGYTDSQTLKDNTLHSTAQPLAAPRRSQPSSDAVHYQVPECREMQMHMPKSNCSFNSFPVPSDNFRHSDSVNMHNRGYSLRSPHHVPSNQFSFVHREQHVKHHREFQIPLPPPPPPPPPYSNRHHLVQNMERENFYNNHERLTPHPYDHRERWNAPVPYSDRWYQDRDVPPPYSCHPCESSRLPEHGWRFPPRSMDHRNSMPFRPPPFYDAIPVANRGPNFWLPR